MDKIMRTYQCFPSEGVVGGAGGGFPPGIKTFFFNLGSNSLPMSHCVTNVCQKSPGGTALKFTHNFFKNFDLRFHSCVKVFCQITKGSNFLLSNPQGNPAHSPSGENTDRCMLYNRAVHCVELKFQNSK